MLMNPVSETLAFLGDIIRVLPTPFIALGSTAGVIVSVIAILKFVSNL